MVGFCVSVEHPRAAVVDHSLLPLTVGSEALLLLSGHLHIFGISSQNDIATIQHHNRATAGHLRPSIFYTQNVTKVFRGHYRQSLFSVSLGNDLIQSKELQ